MTATIAYAKVKVSK